MTGIRGLAMACGTSLLAGCAAVEYYGQAITGHIDIMRRAVSIDEELLAPDASEARKARLERALKIRNFASRELALPDNRSYRSYVELNRPYAVWNVFAAEEFAIKPKLSCFPFVGCVSYRGYYAEADAQKHARKLRDQGYDVFVGGVAAYSTLGWFDDPLLSTFLNYPDAEVARLIFHELAHQVVYVKNDTMFNESFAVAVEEEGVRRWLERNGTAEQRARYGTFQQRRREFLTLIMHYRGRLRKFYEQPGSVEAKRAGKAQLFGEVKGEYEALKASWGGFSGYDRFFSPGPNNALLASIATYTDLVPAFRALLASRDGDMQAFYDEVKKLSRLRKEERALRFTALAPPGR